MLQPDALYDLNVSSGHQDTVMVLYLTTLGVYFATEPVSGLTSTAPIVSRPSLAQSQMNPLSAISSIGSVSLSLLDQGRAVTLLRQTATIRGQEAQLYQGYRGMAWDPDVWLRALRGKVKVFKQSGAGNSWDLEIADRFDQADVTVFDPDAVAAEPWIGGDKSFDSGSLVIRDTDADNVYDTVIVGGPDGLNPVEIALRLLLSGGGDGSLYDVWPAWAGAGLTEDEVDVAWCQAERDKILTVPMQFTLSGEESAKGFVEEQICKALGGYTLLSGEGKIRIHYPSSPNNTAELTTIDDSVLIAKPLPEDSSEYFITHIVFRLDFDGNDFGLTLRRASPQYLAGDYKGEEVEHAIDSEGLQTALGGASIADAVMDELFQRYGSAPAVATLQTFYSRHIVEAGDVVRMTSVFWPDTDGRGVGAERLLEMLSVKPNRDRAEMTCIDLTGPLTAGQRAIIAPNFSPAVTYTTASDAQKDYGFIADHASEEFSNSDPAMVWS